MAHSLTSVTFFCLFFPAYSAYHQTDWRTWWRIGSHPLTRCSLIHSQRTARSISEELASDNARCSDDLQKAEGSSGSHSSSKPDSAHKSDKDKDKKDKEKEERDEGKCVEHSHAALTFPHFHLLFLPCRKTMHFFGVVVRWMLCEWLRSWDAPLWDALWHTVWALSIRWGVALISTTNQTQLFFSSFWSCYFRRDRVGKPPTHFFDDFSVQFLTHSSLPVDSFGINTLRSHLTHALSHSLIISHSIILHFFSSTK